MKLETILNAAKNSMVKGKHKPHCCDLEGEALDRAVQSEIDNIGFEPAYAGRGYTEEAIA